MEQGGQHRGSKQDKDSFPPRDYEKLREGPTLHPLFMEPEGTGAKAQLGSRVEWWGKSGRGLTHGSPSPAWDKLSEGTLR